MAVTVLHVAGAAVWIGGLIHLAGFWQLRRREANAGGYGPVVLARFSDLAIASVALLVLPGLYLAWVYVGDLDALIGTGYGVMVLTKVVLLLATLTLGGINLLLVKSWRRSWPDPGPARRIPALVEAEVGLGVTILLAAASLTSLPPSIDIGADRASPAEVMARFVPKLPRLASPPVQDLLRQRRAHRRHARRAPARGIRLVGIQPPHGGDVRVRHGSLCPHGAAAGGPLGAALAAHLPRARRIPLHP